MLVFLYGSIANSEIQNILFNRELFGSPYILRNYCVYENSITHEYYVSPVDFGFIRGETVEITEMEKVILDEFLYDYIGVTNEDNVLVYMRKHIDDDIEVPWGRLERLVCDMEWLKEKARNKWGLPMIRKIELTPPSSFSEAVDAYKSSLASKKI